MKLYTKTGDDGTTGLFGGTRVSKDGPRVGAYGAVDELNAALGVAIAGCEDTRTVTVLRGIQSELFTLGTQLATPSGAKDTPKIADFHIARLEQWIDEIEDELPPLANFVLPGGSASAAALHVARTVCRRAERAVVTLAREEPTDGGVIAYLNRLGDLMFSLARRANLRSGVADILWTQRG